MDLERLKIQFTILPTQLCAGVIESDVYPQLIVETSIDDKMIIVNYTSNESISKSQISQFSLENDVVKSMVDDFENNVSNFNAETRTSTLNSFELLSTSSVPTDNEMLTAYIIWMYTYVCLTDLVKLDIKNKNDCLKNIPNALNLLKTNDIDNNYINIFNKVINFYNSLN